VFTHIRQLFNKNWSIKKGKQKILLVSIWKMNEAFKIYKLDAILTLLEGALSTPEFGSLD
jgi:hypothetical protein